VKKILLFFLFKAFFLYKLILMHQ